MSNKETEKGTRDKQSTGKKITLRSPSSFQIFDTFSAQSDKLLHRSVQKKNVSRKFTQGTKQKISGAIRTSSEELVDRWVLREALASVDFFKRLKPRVEATLLT
jgi:hypothetical protein